MKLKIKVKEITEGCFPEIKDKGEWIDLRAAETVRMKAAKQATFKREDENRGYKGNEMFPYYISLGVAMQLPKGFEAVIASRSSSPEKFGFMIPNSIGIIDGSYNGNNDIWKAICTPMRDTIINKGDRICQFRIQLSQKATVWQKIKWLLSSGVELVRVDCLCNKNRGGFGSTGEN